VKRLSTPVELKDLRQSILEKTDPNKTCVTVCGGTGCSAWGSEEVRGAFLQELKAKGLENKVEIKMTGCHGFCERGPVTVILPEEIFYQQITKDDVPEIVAKTLMKKEIVERLLYADPITGKKIVYDHEVPFYKKQKRIVFRDNGRIDPTSITDYIIHDGYAALGKALTTFSPEQVIETVEKSGSRGRGGAGFPTGTKWRFARASAGDTKYLICNADEGDPGAFMDRSVLEGNPHSVLEGMLIGAYAIGAESGYVYVRAEYPLAIKHLKIAISQAEELGLLGDNILDTGFNFHLHIKEGAGAFVCGEETALIASIEGKRGMPRARPPFPATSGLWGKPTNINNVETFANISAIILNGADWFASIGTEKSKGTKIFSLTGKINNTGLVEVPMGTTLREVVYDIGGGILRGRKFKSAQMGGPSGGCVPTPYLDLPIDYESLIGIGSMMGSGGMIVMDDSTCMVDVARFFLSFTQTESCGKCTPCRIGTKRMLEILTRITQGKGRPDDIELLEEMGTIIKDTALCGLGQTAPNPVLSTIKYFRKEYEDHIEEKRCEACACEGLVISPCQHTCPAGIDVPNYIAYIAEGEYIKSADLIRERNPFVAICGRICHHPCEYKCRRGEIDDPLAIRSLKRFAADWYFDHVQDLPRAVPKTRKEKVAIIGAGPAGLTCAFFLAKMGYPVTIFEALPVGGGMLAVGVPEFRLPLEVIKKEIEYIEATGVEIKYNTPLKGSLDDLKAQGFQAIFVAVGAHKSQKMGIPGEEAGLEGVYFGIDFLKDVKLKNSAQVGNRVAVIGGGNTAMDAARSALRLGAKKVDVYYRRSREEMPVSPEEYEEAVEEGIMVNFLVAPTEIIGNNGRATSMKCVRMKLGNPDASGRRKPEPIPGSEFVVEADTIIPAIGQIVDTSFLPSDNAIAITKWGTFTVNTNTLATNVPGVFAGGDCVSGPGMAIYAIAAGRRAAFGIHKFLRGDASRVDLSESRRDITHESAYHEEEMKEKKRLPVHCTLSHERIKSFTEVEVGYSEEAAREEAKRCLRCDLSK
jgi:NADH-quinone oxidoreductase subunit F